MRAEANEARYRPLQPSLLSGSAPRLGAAAGLAGSCCVLALVALSARGGSHLASASPRPKLRLMQDFAVDRPREATAAAMEGAGAFGGYMTNAKKTKYLTWTPATRTVRAAVDAAFPGGEGWSDTTFNDGGVTVTLDSLAAWVKDELLDGLDPFATHGGKVPVPDATENAVEPGKQFDTPEDQLNPGEWVSYSRRQLCFIVAKSLIGSSTEGYDNGLQRFIFKEVGGQCTPGSSDFGKAWWGLLAACAADPNLKAGAQGPILIAAKAKDMPSMADVRDMASATLLSEAQLRSCSFDDGSNNEGAEGISQVPEAACKQPSAGAPGTDFHGGALQGQAIQDISADFLGGYIYGNACGLGGGQDERLMVYYPEISALTFFLSEAGPDGKYGPPQLREPAWILGARRLRNGLDGTCFQENLFTLDPAVPLTSDLVDVQLNGAQYQISGSKPFVAFKTINQGFLGWPESKHDLGLARANKEPRQRDVSTDGKYSFEKQVRAWYRAMSLTSYGEEIQPVMKTVVTSVGVGPWGAGLWWGDSQVSFMAMWIGHALAASTWGHSLPLDYYVYSTFTENPGNQCLMHSKDQCAACLAQCVEKSVDQRHAFWLPGEAFMQLGEPYNPCATTDASCGQHGFQELVRAYERQTAGGLWGDIEASLHADADVPVENSAFDLLLAQSSRLKQ